MCFNNFWFCVCIHLREIMKRNFHLLKWHWFICLFVSVRVLLSYGQCVDIGRQLVWVGCLLQCRFWKSNGLSSLGDRCLFTCWASWLERNFCDWWVISYPIKRCSPIWTLTLFYIKYPVLFWHRVLLCSWPRTCYVDQGVPKLIVTFLSLPLEFWHYR